VASTAPNLNPVVPDPRAKPIPVAITSVPPAAVLGVTFVIAGSGW
jgi:hypothetical protein